MFGFLRTKNMVIAGKNTTINRKYVRLSAKTGTELVDLLVEITSMGLK